MSKYPPDLRPRIRDAEMAKVALVLLGIAVIMATILLTAACASTGTSDPVIVRAEDVESNSLSLYNAVVVQWHMTHSQEESPEVYAVLEKIRVEFPPAWRTLHRAIPAYEKVRDEKTLLEKLTPVEDFYRQMKEVWAAHLLPNEKP